jgi:hypothetical protein
VTATLRRRVERLETQGAAAVSDGAAILVGSVTEEDVERLHGAGVLTIITVPRNGRETEGASWRRSKPD